MLSSFSMFAKADQEPVDLLEKNYLKWKNLEIYNYQLTVQDQTCWCMHAMGYGPIKNYIQGNNIIKSIYLGERRDGYRNGIKVKNKSSLEMTIEQVFQRARVIANKANANSYKITYDDKYGFPTIIDYDDPDMEDEQSRLVVSEFSEGLK